MSLFGFGKKNNSVRVEVSVRESPEGHENGRFQKSLGHTRNYQKDSAAVSQTLENELKQLHEAVSAQDCQIQAIQDAEDLYKDDIDSLVRFWEEIWDNGGLLFNGSKWTFRLPDLYIKQKKYDDALRILKKIKNPIYKDKKNSYVKRVEELKEKSSKKNQPVAPYMF